MEIINPSDKCFLDTEDIEAGACATLIISDGHYSLRNENDDEILPLMMFVKSEQEIDDIWKKKFGHSLSDFTADPQVHKRLADACDTFYYEDERGSLNDIGKAFKDFAQGHREKAESESK